MLRHLTIISNIGITLYHKSYVTDSLDDVLFSALSGAIIAFSKELGDELQSIIMKKQMIYFKTLGENIVIFSFNTDFNISFKDLEKKLNEAIKSKVIQSICDMGISQHSNKTLDEELLQFFEVSDEYKKKMMEDQEEIEDNLSAEELTGDAFLDALSKLDSI